MKIALCTVNPTVGDLDGNKALILDAARDAVRRGAELALFPELCLPGYPPLDLLERASFVDACLRARDALVAKLPPELTVVFGNIRRRPRPPEEGRALQNAAVVARGGEIIASVAKTLLPTYDVFDEARYFAPRAEAEPALVHVAGLRIGVTVCEDIWNDEELWATDDLPRDDSPSSVRAYARDPVEDLAAAGADLVVNLSASPFNRGKPSVRERIVTHAARRHGVSVAYLNAVGGNDGLLFDRHAMLATAREGLVHRSHGWTAAVEVVDLDRPGPRPEPLRPDTEQLREALCLGIRDYFDKSGLKKAVIGLSGGIDSALTCALAVRALGPERVLGVGMPSAISSDHSVEDAEQLARNLGIEFHLVPIAAPVEAFEATLAPVFSGRERDVTEENLQSRVRGTTLMAIANKMGGVVLGTGNKSEASMGYATLYGDTIGAISVLADLYKHQVYDVSRLINEERELIPRRSIDKPPSAELRPDQKDSDSLPDYALLDGILERFIEKKMDPAAIADDMGADPALVHDVVRKVYFNEFKRKQMPPTLRVCRKAWVGRVYPIVQGFRT